MKDISSLFEGRVRSLRLTTGECEVWVMHLEGEPCVVSSGKSSWGSKRAASLALRNHFACYFSRADKERQDQFEALYQAFKRDNIEFVKVGGQL